MSRSPIGGTSTWGSRVSLVSVRATCSITVHGCKRIETTAQATRLEACGQVLIFKREPHVMNGRQLPLSLLIKTYAGMSAIAYKISHSNWAAPGEQACRPPAQSAHHHHVLQPSQQKLAAAAKASSPTLATLEPPRCGTAEGRALLTQLRSATRQVEQTKTPPAAGALRRAFCRPDEARPTRNPCHLAKGSHA